MFSLSGKTVYTSTGGTSGTPLDWSNSATWSSSGSGSPLVYIIRAGNYVNFNTNNSSPYVDTVFIYGHLLMSNNRVMTLTGTGGLALMNNTASISGGSANTQFQWNGTGAVLTGPFTSSNVVTGGPRYATAATVLAAAGAIQSSFVSGILPVGIVAFQAICNDRDVYLNWTTAMEWNSDRFEILFANNDLNWSMVHSQPAAGISNDPRIYNFRHQLPKRFANQESMSHFYYRLKMIDVNDNFTYSEIIQANCRRIVTDELEISVSPNPVEDAAVVSFAAKEEGPVCLSIFNESGRQIREQNYIISDDMQQLQIDFSDLPAGVYRLRALTTGASRTTTFIKI